VPQFEISHNVAALLTSCAADADEIIAAQESCGSIMSKRIDKSWLVFLSIENFDHDRCVDLFSRRDGSCGFEEFRRDVEDRGEWTPVRYYSGSVYTSQESALAAAMQAVAWLPDAIGQSSAAQKLLRRISS
jgi:hypothetical protein